MECDSGDAIACALQFWDQLENRRNKDNEMSGRMWEVVETKARKTRVSKIERKRKGKERRGEEKKVKEEKMKNQKKVRW